MKRTLRWFAATALVVLAGCGPTRKSVFPPSAQVQELHMLRNGDWQITLRLQNNSYTGMRFDNVQLHMMLGKHDAGLLSAAPHLGIPQFAADVVDIRIKPGAAAAAALAAIANKGSSASLSYHLDGTVSATPKHEKTARTFKIKQHDWLSPVPGIPNTFR